MTPLCELARKYETDKGGQHYRYGGGDSDTCHEYTPVYHQLFEYKRDAVRSVLEIGIHQGCSLRMWKEYFPNAQIVGIDSNAECMKHSDDRIICLMADQNSPASLYAALAHLMPDIPKFDLIVDDGSHEREHQITSLQTLLPFLANYGVYVIEDLGTALNTTVFSPLLAAVSWDYEVSFVKIVGGLGSKVQPHEWLMVVRRRCI